MKKKSETKVPKTVAELVTDLNENTAEETEKDSGIVENTPHQMTEEESEIALAVPGSLVDRVSNIETAQNVTMTVIINSILEKQDKMEESINKLNNFMAVMSKYIPQQPDRQPLRMKTYTVMPEDTMAKIAKKLFGNPGHAGRIVGLNNDQITRAEDIVPGMVLKLPVI